MIGTYIKVSKVKVRQGCCGFLHHFLIKFVTDHFVARQEPEELHAVWAAVVDNRETGVVGLKNDIVRSGDGPVPEGHVAFT